MLCSWAFALSIVGCGGGGGGEVNSAAPLSGTDQGAAQILSTAQSSAEKKGETATTSPAPAAPLTSSNAEAIGTARVLSATASLALEGVPEAPSPAAPLPLLPGGRVLHVNSQTGDDRNDGLTAAPASVLQGPWRTLSRLQQADVRPGDRIVLGCGSVWRETLRLAANGSAASPIVISAPTTGCPAGALPAIDGAAPVPLAVWSQESATIWKAAVSAPVLQVLQAGQALLPAHHPNRGHDASDPTSPYLRIAAAGNSVSTAYGTGSNLVPVGQDLRLPSGVRLTDGARVRVRTNAWHMDEAAVTAFDGQRLTLSRPTNYTLAPGWGYYLTGQSWMVDSPGEWHHDATSGVLRVWMPDSARPPQSLRAVTLATAVELENRSHVVIDGLAVAGAGQGFNLRAARGIQLRNVLVADITNNGVDAADSINVSVDSSTFLRIGANAIDGGGRISGDSVGLIVRNNLVRDSGVLMQGEQVLSLPRLVFAAILAARDATVTGNVVINSGYIGIRVRGGSRVEDNFIFGACSVLDDCAAIYAWNDAGVTIRGNTVLRSRGYLPGMPRGMPTAAQGIYFDESMRSSLIEHNTVIDTDNGIQLHIAYGNTLRGNLLYANRSSQIWLQATRAVLNPGGDVFDNVIVGNRIAPVLGNAVGVRMETPSSSTAAFASFADNIYFDRLGAIVAAESTPAGQQVFDMTGWQRSSGVGSALPVDAAGAATTQTPFAVASVAGPNLIANPSFEQGSGAWASWNATAPFGSLRREPCAGQTCLRYLPGASPGILISPNFTVRAGQWYRLTVDLAADQEGQDVQIVLRRGGGGTNGYETVSDRSLRIKASRELTRYTSTFRATTTVTARDPITGDNGARLDIDNLVSGRSVALARVELVPVQPSSTALVHGAMVNAGRSTLTVPCPYTGEQALQCGYVFDMQTQRPIQWPMTVQPHRAVGFYLQDPQLADADRDGIADVHDACPGTPSGRPADATGCALGQR